MIRKLGKAFIFAGLAGAAGMFFSGHISPAIGCLVMAVLGGWLEDL